MHCSHITMTVATPQPTTPIEGKPTAGQPQARAMDSGSFSARPPNCRFITALGRELAVLKPR